MRKKGRRRVGRTESRTDGDLDGHHHTISYVPSEDGRIKIKGVIVKHYSPPKQQSRKSYFKLQGQSQITRSLTLVSFERSSLVEYACQI